MLLLDALRSKQEERERGEATRLRRPFLRVRDPRLLAGTDGPPRERDSCAAFLKSASNVPHHAVHFATAADCCASSRLELTSD